MEKRRSCDPIYARTTPSITDIITKAEKREMLKRRLKGRRAGKEVAEEEGVAIERVVVEGTPGRSGN